MNRRPVLVAPRRTPIGNAGHGFATLTTTELAAPVLREVYSTLRAAGIDAEIDDVVLGNCLGPGGDPARIAALAAGFGTEVPGVTVDRQCGSGLDAVMQAALRVQSGADELILAGGVESASTAPWRFWPPAGDAEPVRYTRAPFAPQGFPDPDMGAAADDLARVRGISRERQDAYAARSHSAAAAADFSAELVPIGDVRRDERIRAGLTEARLARLRPSFGADGTATAGNSCGISDGAAVVAVTTEAGAAGLPALRILGSAVAGSDPAHPGLGPVPAIRKLLWRTGVGVADLGIVEITEAFASVVLAVSDELGLDESTICPQGGAIAMGHPWGASGAILLVRLASQMLCPDGPALGLAACAIGGGQGIAMLVERVS
ncbi:putative acetyl-CoA acetyltransferase [Nocardia brasiliensis NBRC 14402]|uniref:thiolase family protein n=1 Tax=Nocardia brasiliensis TaxID=37326 RepID=UPI000301E98F|nr:thiolase family protein [Nocardia brasiliensis]ASF08458.1 acetyl-CoA C-acyltransferase [Nocardia brasiliensis]GAJ85717.1 putative acetyl-CoA acetyltransferase [Nocardia brasiliensis NBRC 14402]SUB41060.1 Probable acetyl-CoA acyltransferase [Nocardia brasiliensis]